MGRLYKAVVAGAILTASIQAAEATEAGFGRYIPGFFAGPASEIVPPEPGFYWQSSTFYYFGTAAKNPSFPFGGALQTGIKASFLGTAISGIWVSDWIPSNGVTVGLGVTIPVGTARVSADLGRLRLKDTDTGLGDILIIPTIGYHNGPHFFAANIGIYAPTGHYDHKNLANIGLNVWTFTPSLAYTYINPELGIDFSMVGGIDINTTNPKTKYRSGALAHVDATLLKTFSNGIGVGIFGSILYQLADDRGELADKLDGFRGRSFAIGPMIKYSVPNDKHQLSAAINWAPEFGVENRLKGNAVYLNISGRF